MLAWSASVTSDFDGVKGLLGDLLGDLCSLGSARVLAAALLLPLLWEYSPISSLLGLQACSGGSVPCCCHA